MTKTTDAPRKGPTAPTTRDAKQVKPNRKSTEDTHSAGRDDKLIGSERFPRKGDDEE
jgi:hypothetical protein